jgi:hypothetical protein
LRCPGGFVKGFPGNAASSKGISSCVLGLVAGDYRQFGQPLFQNHWGHSAPQPLYIYSFLAQLGRSRASAFGGAQ